MLKEYVVCDECIKGEYGHYSIRVNTDCSPARFRVLASFDTFEEANNFLRFLLD